MLLESIQGDLGSYEGAFLESSIKAMVKKFHAYQEIYDGQYVYKLATVLDPRIELKFFSDMNENTQDIRHQLLKRAQLYNAHEQRQTATSNLEKSGFNSYASQLYKKRKTIDLNDEIDRFLNGEVKDSDTDPLLWWKSKATTFPSLTEMAWAYLSVPATSVPSERLFFAGRRIITDFRGSLSASNSQALMCLENWLKNDFIDL